MENAKEQVVSSFDFGPHGVLELTASRLKGFVSGETKVVDSSGRNKRSKDSREEVRIKLDQLKNCEFCPPGSTVKKVLLLLGILICLTVLMQLMGWGIGLLICLFFSASAKFAAWLGFIGDIVGLGLGIWMLPKGWRGMSLASIRFNMDDGNMAIIPCDSLRASDLESFVQIVKKTRKEYMDSL